MSQQLNLLRVLMVTVEINNNMLKQENERRLGEIKRLAEKRGLERKDSSIKNMKG